MGEADCIAVRAREAQWTGVTSSISTINIKQWTVSRQEFVRSSVWLIYAARVNIYPIVWKQFWSWSVFLHWYEREQCENSIIGSIDKEAIKIKRDYVSSRGLKITTYKRIYHSPHKDREVFAIQAINAPSTPSTHHHQIQVNNIIDLVRQIITTLENSLRQTSSTVTGTLMPCDQSMLKWHQ